MIELVASMAIASILLTAMASSIVWVTRALPSTNDPISTALDASDGMQRFAEELRYATKVTARTSKSITFEVPDQNGDGTVETLTYSWSGVAGAPLLRTYNNSAAIQVVKKVKTWSLDYDVAAIDVPRSPIESAETTFYTPGLTLLTTAHLIRSTDWVAQVFKPSSSGSATQYRVTRINFRARYHDSSTGPTTIRVVRASGSTPSGTIYAQGVLSQSVLTSGFTWFEMTFPDSTPIAITDKCALEFRQQGALDACDVQSSLLTISLSGATWASTGDAGKTWSQDALKSGSMYIYGTYLTPQTPTKRYELVSVTSRLTVSNGRGAPNVIAVATANRPDTP
jgi:hypothetical protein